MNKTKASTSPKESLKYQNMLEQVEGIVRGVSSGPMDLDDVVTKVELGYKLIREMRERLETTKAKVEKLRTDFENDAKPSAANTAPNSSQADETDTEAFSAQASDDDDDAPF